MSHPNPVPATTAENRMQHVISPYANPEANAINGPLVILKKPTGI